MQRRKFITLSGGFVLTGFRTFDLGRKLPESLHFGICTDVHKDLVPDADQRLARFIDMANTEKPDFIIQLGDFCTPKPENREFLDIFHSFAGPKYHVIGNHDMDGGFKKDDTVNFYGMPARYYSFDLKSFHFIVLDGTVGPYPWTIDREQLDWLDHDLSATRLPTFLFIHEPLEDSEAVSNASTVREMLEKSVLKRNTKVVGCFEGHRHMDYMKVVKNIPYFQINSMSYFWLGPKYLRKPENEETDREYPAMKYYSRYRDPLFCFVSVSKQGNIRVEGRSSVFIDGTPAERGYSFQAFPPEEITASITGRVRSFDTGRFF